MVRFLSVLAGLLALDAAQRRRAIRRRLRRQAAHRHRRGRCRRHHRHARPRLRGAAAQAHPGQPDHRGAEHAGRRQHHRHQPCLRARGARRPHHPLQLLGSAGAGARRPAACARATTSSSISAAPATSASTTRAPTRCRAASRRRATSSRPTTSSSARSTRPTSPGLLPKLVLAGARHQAPHDRRLSRRPGRLPGDAARRGPVPLDQHLDLPQPQRRLRQVRRR